MRIALFAAILLAVVSVPAAYASTLQLVTENGNVFSIDFDEILFLWEMQNPSNQTQTITAIQQEIADLRTQLISITNTTDVGSLQDRIDELQEQLNSNSTSTGTAIMLLESEIGMLREQLTMALTNSTATEAEIDALQETIATLTTDLENLEQDGIGAGALGTSGRMVSAALDGYVIYGEHGKLGTISEATTYNRYTGPVDYVGIIPDKDYFTKYSLDSPNGQYTVHNSELVPAPGSSKWVRTNGDKVLEGSAPVINNDGRDVEIDVSGKVLVQLDESRLGNGAVIGVDTEGVTVQVVTSRNDLINTEYRIFNETGKFVLFEAEAEYEPLTLVRNFNRWTCQSPCDLRDHDPNGHVYFSSMTDYYGYRYYSTYNDDQRAIPSVTDVHVSNIDEMFDDSDVTLKAKYSAKFVSYVLQTYDRYFDSNYFVNSTAVDRLWHVTGFLNELLYSFSVGPIGIGGEGPATMSGHVAAHGMHRITDATPYAIQGSVEPFDSKTISTGTDSNVYVLLDSGNKDQTYVVDTVTDTIQPFISSIGRHNPPDAVTRSDTLVYKIVFSEDVLGVDSDDFVLSPDSTIVDESDGYITYTESPNVQIYSRVSDTITVPNNATNADTNLLVYSTVNLSSWSWKDVTITSPAGVVHHVDANSINYFGSGSAVGDWRIDVDYTRSGSTTARLVDWSLTVLTSNPTRPVTSVTGSGDTYYLTVPATRNGTHLVALGVDTGITDGLGNPLINRIPDMWDNRLYIATNVMDDTPPTVSSIERDTPSVQNTNRQTLTYKVMFSEDVTGVDVFDFVLSPDSVVGNNRPATSVTGSGDTYYVTIPATQDGTYNLDLASTGHGVADIAGHSMVDVIPVSGVDETYVKTGIRDMEDPTLSSIERYEPSNKYVANQSLTYKIMFSEDVTGVDKLDFVLSPDSTGEVLFTFPPSAQTAHRKSPNISLPNFRTTSDIVTVSVSQATSISVAVDISHSAIGNLKVDLIAPDGTIRTLHNRTGGNDDDLTRTYVPDFNGVPITGNWTLQVYSHYSSPTARLNDWSLIINQGSPYHVASLSGSGDTYYATVIPTYNGTFNLDLASSGHGIEDTAGNHLTATTDIGTARISAEGITGAGSVQINGLPGGVPWVFGTIDGQQLHSGLTSSSGSITMPLPDYTMEGVTEEFSLLVYEDGFGHDIQPGNLVADLLNGEFIRHDFGNPSSNIIYIPERYMLYPITVPVDITDVRLGKLTTDCNATDQVRLRYIDGSYDAGSSMYVPFIPGMSVLKFSIDGAPVCVKFADVLPPVQIVPFGGDEASGREAPLIELTADATASAVLATNDPTAITVSFSASGFSEHDRKLQFGPVLLRGDLAELHCSYIRVNNGVVVAPTNCPSEAQDMYSSVARFGSLGVSHGYTTYDVTVTVFKNGQLYDTTTLPINSLSVVEPADAVDTYNGSCGNKVMVPFTISQNTVTGGHNYCATSPHYVSPSEAILYSAMGGTTWGETFAHTFDIENGEVGDHIEVAISVGVVFNFPYPNGNYHPYNTQIIHSDWPVTFETQIINGDDFLGPDYDTLEYTVDVEYNPDNRGVGIKLNDGFITLVSTG